MAETVKTNEFAGGSGLDQGKLARVIRGLVDDIAGTLATAATEADSEATTIASADASDLGTAQTLVNEIKAAYNNDIPLIVALLNEIKTNLNAQAVASPSVTKA